MAKKGSEEFNRDNCPQGLNEEVYNLIRRRRRQMLVHSFIYYRMGASIISDKDFDKWAYELRDLQKEHPKESAACEYAKDFEDWDGTTGFHLPYHYWVEGIARQIIEYHKAKGGLI